MDITSILVSLATGALGGNAAGAAMKDKSLGPVGNSLSGILGGGLGGALLQMLGLGGAAASAAGGAGAGGLDLSTLGQGAAGGGVGGAVLMIVVAIVKQMLASKR